MTKAMSEITIFTPTYNRAHLLGRAFEALKRQENRDFVWLIVDDGSTDNTQQVVSSFQHENCGFSIRYIYKENGGLHTGYNTAIQMIDTPLCMCIDSDDWVADGAVDRILALWQRVKRDDCAGIVGQDVDVSGRPMCVIRTHEEYIDLNAYDAVHRWEGDRKLVIRTELYKQVAPMPSFGEEKYFNPHYMHMRIAQDYQFYVYNEPLCVVDYQEQGMSAGIFRQYLNSPNSFAEYRRLQMVLKPCRFSRILRYAIHYDSSCFLAGKPAEIVTRSPRKLTTLSMSPLGFLLALYVRYKAR